MAEKTLHIECSTLAGLTFEDDVDPELRVRDLKLRVYGEWRLPPICLNLLLDEQSMKDTEQLKQFSCESSEVLAITVIVDLEPAMAGLKKNDPSIRKEAVEALGTVWESDEAAFQAIGKAIHDKDKSVRYAATRILLAAAQQEGSEHFDTVIVMFGSAVSSSIRSVSESAVEALQSVSPKGDARIVGMLCAKMNEGSRSGIAAIDALPKLAEKGDELAVFALIETLSSSDPVASASLKALAKLSPKGHAHAIAAICGKTCSACSLDVKRAAFQALSDIAEPGDEGVIAVASAFCHSDGGSARREALRTLGKISPHGDDIAINAIVPSLTSTSKSERQMAADALSSVADKGDDRIMEVMLPKIRDLWKIKPDNEMRIGKELGEALVLLTKQGDQQIMHEVLANADDYHEYVRRATMDILGCIARTGSTSVLEHLISATEDPAAQVAQAAVAALGQVGEKEDASVITTLCKSLTHKDGWVRRSAAIALGKVAGTGNETVNSALVKCLDDFDTEVVNEALGALSLTAKGGNQAVSSAICVCVQHRDAWIRKSAVEALSQTVECGNPHAIKTLTTCLSEESDEKAAQSAAAVLAKLATHGDEDVICCLVKQLESLSRDVQQAAVDGLAKVAGRGNQIACKAARQLIKCPKPFMKEAAAKTLGAVAVPGDADALGSLYAALGDGEVLVRQAALESVKLIKEAPQQV